MLGKGTCSEFRQSPEGIPTNILADRLKRLQAAGIIDREPCRQKPVRYRYRLTARGRDLSPVIHAQIDWSECHLEAFSVVPGQKPFCPPGLRKSVNPVRAALEKAGMCLHIQKYHTARGESYGSNCKWQDHPAERGRLAGEPG
ncbi:MAG: helix-turn-helix transcriptional regulator [Gammaproteobacteria bacterium]|nr:helix-turn-helix transcriptional regulator [Gammaproteobacteria bacterium]